MQVFQVEIAVFEALKPILSHPKALHRFGTLIKREKQVSKMLFFVSLTLHFNDLKKKKKE